MRRRACAPARYAAQTDHRAPHVETTHIGIIRPCSLWVFLFSYPKAGVFLTVLTLVRLWTQPRQRDRRNPGNATDVGGDRRAIEPPPTLAPCRGSPPTEVLLFFSALKIAIAGRLSEDGSQLCKLWTRTQLRSENDSVPALLFSWGRLCSSEGWDAHG